MVISSSRQVSAARTSSTTVTISSSSSSQSSIISKGWFVLSLTGSLLDKTGDSSGALSLMPRNPCGEGVEVEACGCLSVACWPALDLVVSVGRDCDTRERYPHFRRDGGLREIDIEGRLILAYDLTMAPLLVPAEEYFIPWKTTGTTIG